MGKRINSIKRLLTPAGRQEAKAFLRARRYSIAVSVTVTLVGLLIFAAMMRRSASLEKGFLDPALVFLDNVEARSRAGMF